MTLTSDTYALIADRMRTGGFETADDLVRAALDALPVDDHVEEEDVARINESIAQMRRGDVVDWAAWSAKYRNR